MKTNKKELAKRVLKRWGKSHLTLMKNKANCQDCKKLVSKSQIIPTREKKLVCEDCYPLNRIGGKENE